MLVGELALFSGRSVNPLNLPNIPTPVFPPGTTTVVSLELLGDLSSAEFMSSELLGVDLGNPIAPPPGPGGPVPFGTERTVGCL